MWGSPILGYDHGRNVSVKGCGATFNAGGVSTRVKKCQNGQQITCKYIIYIKLKSNVYKTWSHVLGEFGTSDQLAISCLFHGLND